MKFSLFKRFAAPPETRELAPAAPRSDFNKFELRAPSAKTLIDIFAGKWASDLSGFCPGLEPGGIGLFSDPRVTQAVHLLGANGRFDGANVLELGPLEAGHTYQLELLGAMVTAIEANREAFLKCLIVKELLGLKNSRFLMGDFIAFLEESSQKFDLIYASGVLYHMSDPIRLIELIAAHTDRCFMWTHYYDPAHYVGAQRTPRTIDRAGARFTFYEADYGNTCHDQFWGGNKPVASWLSREDMETAFRAYGFNKFTWILDDPGHINGACATFTAEKY